MNEAKGVFDRVEIPLEAWKNKKLTEMLWDNPGYFAIRALLMEGNKKNALIAIRHEKGFSQKWLADSLGVNQSNIRSWEATGSPIPAEYVAKITALLSITEEELFAVPMRGTRAGMTKEEAKDKWVNSIRLSREHKSEETRKVLMKFFESNKDKKGRCSIAKIATHLERHAQTIRRMVEKNPELYVEDNHVLRIGSGSVVPVKEPTAKIAKPKSEPVVAENLTSKEIKKRMAELSLTIDGYVSNVLLPSGLVAASHEQPLRQWFDSEIEDSKMYWNALSDYIKRATGELPPLVIKPKAHPELTSAVIKKECDDLGIDCDDYDRMYLRSDELMDAHADGVREWFSSGTLESEYYAASFRTVIKDYKELVDRMKG